jgi:hypothetical protein
LVHEIEVDALGSTDILSEVQFKTKEGLFQYAASLNQEFVLKIKSDLYTKHFFVKENVVYEYRKEHHKVEQNVVE